MKRILKLIGITLLGLLAVLVLFVLGVFIFEHVKAAGENKQLKKEGYYNPVSVGDHSLNVAIFGNENGNHTIVAMAGLGLGDFSVSERHLTKYLEDDNLVVFIDRAGYGLSDDTSHEMTIEFIVEDYRKALKNAGIEGPYILMPHSIGGAYATYWECQYPEEIEAIVFLDGTQLSEEFNHGSKDGSVPFGTRFSNWINRFGFRRLLPSDGHAPFGVEYSEEEQALADIFWYRTSSSTAMESENKLIVHNGEVAYNGIVSNDIPKLYICAIWGFSSKEDIVEYYTWIQSQDGKTYRYGNPAAPIPDEETMQNMLDHYAYLREVALYPYVEMLGNCELVLIPGEHMIYEQKPDECAQVILEFLATLDSKE